jgi:hypothetical protein
LSSRNTLTMRKLFLFALVLSVQSLWAQSELAMKLFDLPDVAFAEGDRLTNYHDQVFVLRVKQPLDHENPQAGHFYQRVYLSHAGYDRPTVLATEGYARPANRIYELANLLQANQVVVEHRFFGSSMPDSLDYRYLNLKQATADLHKVRELLGTIYSGKWVSTGISKGGMTTIFYRYFFPDDVAASVPYVAPLNTSLEDERIYGFLDTVGTDECRKAIYKYQIRLLKNRDKALVRLKWFAKGANYTFDYLGLEAAFEYAVLEYPFSFWQWGHSCEDIPTKADDLDTHLDHLEDIVGLSFYNDATMKYFGSHYWQAATEMGYYGYETEEFSEYLKVLEGNPSAIFTPDKLPATFNADLTLKTAEWLKKEGDQFIYIYGGVDTWSATGVPPSEEVDALWIILEGKGHQSARIKNMTEKQREQLVTRLEQWLEIEINE